eukprot:g36398.t1
MLQLRPLLRGGGTTLTPLLGANSTTCSKARSRSSSCESPVRRSFHTTRTVAKKGGKGYINNSGMTHWIPKQHPYITPESQTLWPFNWTNANATEYVSQLPKRHQLQTEEEQARYNLKMWLLWRRKMMKEHGKDPNDDEAFLQLIRGAGSEYRMGFRDFTEEEMKKLLQLADNIDDKDLDWWRDYVSPPEWEDPEPTHNMEEEETPFHNDEDGVSFLDDDLNETAHKKYWYSADQTLLAKWMTAKSPFDMAKGVGDNEAYLQFAQYQQFLISLQRDFWKDENEKNAWIRDRGPKIQAFEKQFFGKVITELPHAAFDQDRPDPFCGPVENEFVGPGSKTWVALEQNLGIVPEDFIERKGEIAGWKKKLLEDFGLEPSDVPLSFVYMLENSDIEDIDDGIARLRKEQQKTKQEVEENVYTFAVLNEAEAAFQQSERNYARRVDSDHHWVEPVPYTPGPQREGESDAHYKARIELETDFFTNLRRSKRRNLYLMEIMNWVQAPMAHPEHYLEKVDQGNGEYSVEANDRKFLGDFHKRADKARKLLRMAGFAPIVPIDQDPWIRDDIMRTSGKQSLLEVTESEVAAYDDLKELKKPIDLENERFSKIKDELTIAEEKYVAAQRKQAEKEQEEDKNNKKRKRQNQASPQEDENGAAGRGDEDEGSDEEDDDVDDYEDPMPDVEDYLADNPELLEKQGTEQAAQDADKDGKEEEGEALAGAGSSDDDDGDAYADKLFGPGSAAAADDEDNDPELREFKSEGVDEEDYVPGSVRVGHLGDAPKIRNIDLPERYRTSKHDVFFRQWFDDDMTLQEVERHLEMYNVDMALAEKYAPPEPMSKEAKDKLRDRMELIREPEKIIERHEEINELDHEQQSIEQHEEINELDYEQARLGLYMLWTRRLHSLPPGKHHHLWRQSQQFGLLHYELYFWDEDDEEDFGRVWQGSELMESPSQIDQDLYNPWRDGLEMDGLYDKYFSEFQPDYKYKAQDDEAMLDLIDEKGLDAAAPLRVPRNLTEAAKDAMYMLHRRDPARWHPRALAGMFNVPLQSAIFFLKIKAVEHNIYRMEHKPARRYLPDTPLDMQDAYRWLLENEHRWWRMYLPDFFDQNELKQLRYKFGLDQKEGKMTPEQAEQIAEENYKKYLEHPGAYFWSDDVRRRKPWPHVTPMAEAIQDFNTYHKPRDPEHPDMQDGPDMTFATFAPEYTPHPAHGQYVLLKDEDVMYTEELRKRDNFRFMSKGEKLDAMEREKFTQVGPIGGPHPPAPVLSILSNNVLRPARFNWILTDISDARNANFAIAVRDKDGFLRSPTPQEYRDIRVREKRPKDRFNYVVFKAAGGMEALQRYPRWALDKDMKRLDKVNEEVLLPHKEPLPDRPLFWSMGQKQLFWKGEHTYDIRINHHGRLTRFRPVKA